MPTSLTKAQIVDSVVKEIGPTRKQFIETVEVLLDIIMLNASLSHKTFGKSSVIVKSAMTASFSVKF
jgi:hypothetical protein